MTENGEARRVQQGGFVTIVGADRARSFYRDANRPEPLKGGAALRPGVSCKQHHAAARYSHRAAVDSRNRPGLRCSEISTMARELESAGVRFERYENIKQDDQGIWTSPTGARVAWFKDPDGNVLSLSGFWR
jgi:hypothetical protein